MADTRKYTVKEVNNMRPLANRVTQHILKVQGYKPTQNTDLGDMIMQSAQLTESILQTYILAGVDPSEMQQLFLKIENEHSL